MKKIIAFITIFFSIVLYANDEQPAVIQMVYNWNRLHNNGNIETFKNLYGNDVLFYGRNRTGQDCYEKKKKYLNYHFQQEIITPVTLELFTTGTIKCSFTKRVTYKKKIKEHECYLLLQKVGNEYVIIGESDLETDSKLGVKLNLGEPLNNQRSEGNYIFLISMIIGIGSIGGYSLYKNKIKKKIVDESPVSPELSQTYVTATQPAVVEMHLVEKVKEAVRDEIKDLLKDNSPHKKGYEFEKYVIEKFNTGYFKTIQWQSDKFHAGHYPLSNTYPDIILEYKDSRQQTTLAIECKWRSEFKNGNVKIAESNQLERYRKFQEEHNIKVFLLLGIGGKSSDPESVYIIPLDDLKKEFYSQYQLSNYYRYKKGNFFLQVNSMLLE